MAFHAQVKTSDGLLGMNQERIFISTDMVEPRYRNNLWRSITLPFFDPAPIEGREDIPFSGTLSVFQLGQLTIGRTTFSAQKGLYTGQKFSSSTLAPLLLQVFKAGSLTGDYAGNKVSVSTGDIVIRDALRPAQSQVTNGSTLMVAVPRSLVPYEIESQLHGAIFQAVNMETRLLTSFLHNLDESYERFSPASISKIENAFVDLLLANVATSNCSTQVSNATSLLILRSRVLEHIQKNIKDPNLSVQGILEHFNVSRAHMYRCFKSDGGIAKAILYCRLDAASKALSDFRFQGKSIEEIAYEFGFSGGKQFGRAFRARFGISPGAFRAKNGVVLQLNDTYAHFAHIAKQRSRQHTH
jgi:AraC-like DNA-binding protein